VRTVKASGITITISVLVLTFNLLFGELDVVDVPASIDIPIAVTAVVIIVRMKIKGHLDCLTRVVGQLKIRIRPHSAACARIVVQDAPTIVTHVLDQHLSVITATETVPMLETKSRLVASARDDERKACQPGVYCFIVIAVQASCGTLISAVTAPGSACRSAHLPGAP
jgi:hypothetical protein